MRTVEQCHLTLVVRFLALGDEHVKSGFLCRELSAQFLARHILGFLDNPQVENLCLYHQVVFITDFLLYLCNLLAGEAGNDAVYQCSAYVAVFREPLLETFIVGTEIVFPQFDILIDALLQVMAVEENQFARHDDETLGGVALKGLIAAVEQLHEFAGITAGGSVAQLARGVEGNACLSGVGDDKAYLRLVGQCLIGPELGIGVQRARDDIDALQCVHGLTVLAALQVDMIETVLTVEPVHHTAFDGLHHHYAAIEISSLVHLPYYPVYESTEEISFTKLDDFLWHHALWSGALVQFLQSFHLFFID